MQSETEESGIKIMGFMMPFKNQIANCSGHNHDLYGLILFIVKVILNFSTIYLFYSFALPKKN